MDKPTMYEDFKKARDIITDGKGKKLISKAGTIEDGPCPLSTDGFCNIAQKQGTEFYCGSNWWKSCTIYLQHRKDT